MTRILILVIAIQLGLPSYGFSQIRDLRDNKGTQDNQSQSQRDWIRIDSLKSLFFRSPSEREFYNNANFLEKKRFEDMVYKNRLRLAEDFLDKYPYDDYYFEVLKFYFHPFFEPLFISETIPDSTLVLLTQDSRLANGNNDFFLHQMRALPIDQLAMGKWLERGNELVATFLESKAPLDEKASIEKRLFGRDLRKALFQYQYLDLQKTSMESAFWNEFDAYYWESFLMRIKDLLFKYKDLGDMALFVQKFISIVTSESQSHGLSEKFWRYFLEITDLSGSNAKHIGIKDLHAMALENLEELGILKGFDDTKPLDMVFTAMDGAKIDLRNMRGKVILIDFWSMRCAPCLQEMPHVKALYKAYRNQGFEVIGIAAEGDASKNQILNILDRLQINWPQKLDKGSDALVSYHSLYNIDSLPTVWLLDKEGKIVDRNARGDRLEPLIIKHLNLD